MQTLLEVSKKILLPEQGGILGFDCGGIIRYFHFDIGGKRLPNQYSPDVVALNKVLAEWYKNGIGFAGIIHSHPGNKNTLSSADIFYAQQICQVCKMKEVLMLLYMPEVLDYGKRFVGYTVNMYKKLSYSNMVVTDLFNNLN